ncbi:GTP-binding protein [Lutimonas halocynthiae]|uniref:GTP-binding protein n=1 Tax=Lutimonas halocynthiae TaxID=1446477 RepID=UPI0025B5C2D5|nr:GTP-binding protein [Lutimonas halocynthiae]MDN3641757.1 GTP-binding protein [Lutimonas halocynthiae]
MNDPIHDDELNRILLKPRFKLKFEASKEEILQQFKESLERKDCIYNSQIIDHHIVIDVPELEEHFWSPQLHVEIEKEDGITVVKGILGPRPKIWTFFMFLHFIVAIAFFVFFVIFYSRWSLDQEYKLAMMMCFLMPFVWIALYFIGQLGKKFGYKQMLGLHDLLTKALKNFKTVKG